MNNEIKEILDFKEDADYKRLSVDEITILGDYITNLQEENERLQNAIKGKTFCYDEEEHKNLQEEIKELKELCDKYEEEHKTTFKIWKKDLKNFEHEKNRELKARIEKAIEYIGNGNLGIPRKTRDKFIKILKGKDNE